MKRKTLAANWYNIMTTMAIEVPKGNISGHFPFNLVGCNTDMNVGVNDIWPISGLYNYPTTNETLTIVSSDNADVGTIRIFGLGPGGTVITNVVTLTGTTPVTTTKEYSFINEAFINGNLWINDRNSGNITITNSVSAQTLAYIPIGEGEIQQAIYRVPSDKALSIMSLTAFGWRATPAQDPQITIRSMIRPQGHAWRDIFSVTINTAVQNEAKVERSISRMLPPLCDIRMEATTNFSNTVVHAQYAGILIDLPEMPEFLAIV